MVMPSFFTPSFDARLGTGGVGSANRGERPLGGSIVFAPMPRGTDTACSADRS
jgi:hypothetical protein